MDTEKLIFYIINFTFFLLLSRSYGEHKSDLDAPPKVDFPRDLKACKFDAIYQFGDSMSDTGNSIVEFPPIFHSRLPGQTVTNFTGIPYGQTIKKFTGRTSDGLLIIDYFALSAGLTPLHPYLNPNSTFKHGVEFAVAGASALNADDLAKFHIPPRATNSSLNVQLQWLDKFIQTKCKESEACQTKLMKSALFMVGAIGATDYNAAIVMNMTIADAKKQLVPQVVQTIKETTKKVIEYNVQRVIVPGIFKLGCTPALLTLFQSNKSAAYDQYGCLKDINEFYDYHNVQLQSALDELRKKYPNVHIVYADIYHAHEWVMENQSKLGFKSLTGACCGAGGKYNFTPGLMNMCGARGIPVCSNVGEHVFWDEWHFTDKAHKYISQWLIKDMLPKLECQD